MNPAWPERIQLRPCLGDTSKWPSNGPFKTQNRIRALREYAVRRSWTIALQVKEVGTGASQRQLREKLLEGGTPPPSRRGAGMAVGPLGPVGDGLAVNSPGTGPPRGRFHLP